MFYLELGDLVAVASRVLGLKVDATLAVTELGLAESALARPQAGFQGEEFYPSLQEKAAALMHGLIKNHPFLDGNKRIATISALMFLNINGYDLDLTPPEEAYEFIAGVAAGDIDFGKLTAWIAARLQPLADG